MRILVCPGNGDKGESGLAMTPVDTIFVEVFEFIYLSYLWIGALEYWSLFGD